MQTQHAGPACWHSKHNCGAHFKTWRATANSAPTWQLQHGQMRLIPGQSAQLLQGGKGGGPLLYKYLLPGCK